MNKELKDRFERSIRYLRVSVTDRCNFRCKYCMPVHDFQFMKHKDILTYEDLLFAVSVFSELGVSKVRITGGEPLVRKGVQYFMKDINELEKIDEVTLTTNGSLLGKYIQEIKDSGVSRINVSLDSLRADRYSEITGGFKLDKIINSIKAARDAGIRPVKVNSVVIKGFNDDEIFDFCEFSAENDIITRFIEFMPVGNFNEWKKENIMTGDEILKKISEKYKMEPAKKEHQAGPAKNFRLSNGALVGVITPVSNHFCSECDKLRITADGKLRPCLLSDDEIDISEPIRNRDKDALIKSIADGLNLKLKEHDVMKEQRKDQYKRTMSKIGG